MAIKGIVASGADNVNTYATVDDWWAARPATFTEPEILMWPDGDFEEPVSIGSKTTSAANFAAFYAASGARHTGRSRSITGTGARLKTTLVANSSVTMRVSVDHFRCVGLEIAHLDATDGVAVAYNFSTFTSASKHIYDECLIHDKAPESSKATAWFSQANLNLELRNTFIYGNQRVLDTRDCLSVLIENDTLWCHTNQIVALCETNTVIKNSYAGKATGANQDWWQGGGAFTGNNNAASDTTGTTRFTSSLNSIAGSAVFTSVAADAEDFRLKTGTNALVGVGATLASTATDILGNTRTAPYDIGGHQRNGAPATTAPGAPTIGTATGGNASASVAGTAPASDGGSAITGYTATAYKVSDNTVVTTGTNATLPVTVTGLTNGVAVYFKLKATNTSGTGPESAASNSVTPAVPVVAPTGAITSITVDGQTVTISGTTTNTPTSGSASLVAAGGGAVTQGPTALTLGSGTFTITFTGVPAGSYTPSVLLSNSGGGPISATGGSTVIVNGTGGSPAAPGEYPLTIANLSQGATIGTPAVTLPLAIASLTQGATVSTPSITHSFIGPLTLQISGLTQGASVSTPTIGQVAPVTLSISGLSQGATAQPIVINNLPPVNLVIAGMTQLAVVDSVAILTLATTASSFLAEVPINDEPGILADFPKQPFDLLDYDVSYAKWLSARGDTANSATVTVPDGLTLMAYTLADGVIKVWLAGGEDGEKYKVTVRLSTRGGRTKEAEINIKVKDT